MHAKSLGKPCTLLHEGRRCFELSPAIFASYLTWVDAVQLKDTSSLSMLSGPTGSARRYEQTPSLIWFGFFNLSMASLQDTGWKPHENNQRCSEPANVFPTHRDVNDRLVF